MSGERTQSMGEPGTSTASATDPEQTDIAIVPAEETVADDFGGDEAEGDAIPTVTESKIGVGKPGMDADISKAVFFVSKRAGPGVGDFQREFRKKPPELFHEGSGLLGNQGITVFRTHEVLVLATDDDAPFGGGPQIQVRSAAFPYEAAFMPSANRRERLADERISAFQASSIALQETFPPGPTRSEE